ncbi:hypothetical protein BURMUCF1_A0636 [Burkholderia multivorans ATCC BAA-247]|uniref:Uncharacterized protein n=1 Tax=Burkholderia multivorans CGD2 TaxID=513052 RepID=B9BHL6_9BURK|nr:hypothetical protein BURMUCGD2_4571 [Burkholderia multivorans CGD2]EJO59589.1 hypothetical protein BURMUCF1_A0636 [Burkholderia multivorans ATCC BAA-247]
MVESSCLSCRGWGAGKAKREASRRNRGALRRFRSATRAVDDEVYPRHPTRMAS